MATVCASGYGSLFPAILSFEPALPLSLRLLSCLFIYGNLPSAMTFNMVPHVVVALLLLHNCNCVTVVLFYFILLGF